MQSAKQSPGWGDDPGKEETAVEHRTFPHKPLEVKGGAEEAVWRAFAGLEARERLLVAMHDLLGWDIQQIARVMKWSPERVEKRMRPGREALLLADHNAYHLGQLVQIRKALGR